MIYLTITLYLIKNIHREGKLIGRLWAILLLVLILSGCSSTSAMDNNVGRLEKYNRAMFSFNNKMDRFIIRPVAKGYRAVTTKYFRSRVTNFFNNLEEPVSAFNHILQGELSSSGNNVGRFVINSTFGLIGLFDVASSMGLGKDRTGFDETLAAWCVPDGPFIILPIIGPSTPRAATGFVADIYSSPVYWAANESTDDAKTLYYTASGVKYLNLIAENLNFLEGLEEGSVDYYEAVKSAYVQNRSKLKKCGKSENTVNYDFDMDDMDYE